MFASALREGEACKDVITAPTKCAKHPDVRALYTQARLFIYLFTFIEGKGGRKRGRETSMCGCLSRASCWGPGPQPRHVPLLCRPMLSPLSHTSQGYTCPFNPPGHVGFALWILHGGVRDGGAVAEGQLQPGEGGFKPCKGSPQRGSGQFGEKAGEACEAKMKGNKCSVLPFFPSRRSPLRSCPSHMCRDIKGGDSRSLCSAGASGQNCSRIPSQRLGLS